MILKKIFLSLIFILNIEVLSKSLDPIQLLSDFVAVDTINPPGNESRAVEFYAKIFEEEGIEYSKICQLRIWLPRGPNRIWPIKAAFLAAFRQRSTGHILPPVAKHNSEL